MQKLIVNEEGVKLAPPLKIVTRQNVVCKEIDKHPYCIGWPHIKLSDQYKRSYENTVLEFGPNKYGEIEMLLARYFTCTFTHDLSIKVNINWYFRQMAKMYVYLVRERFILPRTFGPIGMLEYANRDLGTNTLFDEKGIVTGSAVDIATIHIAANYYIDSNDECCPVPIPNNNLTKAVSELNKTRVMLGNRNRSIATKVFFMFVFPFEVRGTDGINLTKRETDVELVLRLQLPGFCGEGQVSDFHDWHLIDNLERPINEAMRQHLVSL